MWLLPVGQFIAFTATCVQQNSINYAIRRRISPREIWTQFNFLAQKRVSPHFYVSSAAISLYVVKLVRKKKVTIRDLPARSASGLIVQQFSVKVDNFSVLTSNNEYRAALFSHINLYRAPVHSFPCSISFPPPLLTLPIRLILFLFLMT